MVELYLLLVYRVTLKLNPKVLEQPGKNLFINFSKNIFEHDTFWFFQRNVILLK